MTTTNNSKPAAPARPTGVVNIHGRDYETVALRVKRFRESHPMWAIVTEIVSRDADVVLVRATIADETGRIVSTGHAEEWRKASSINKTSAVENAETSAIGRALASFGLSGTEFASAEEVAAQQRAEGIPELDPVLVAQFKGAPSMDALAKIWKDLPGPERKHYAAAKDAAKARLAKQAAEPALAEQA